MIPVILTKNRADADVQGKIDSMSQPGLFPGLVRSRRTARWQTSRNIRKRKPQRIVEIGCGISTLPAIAAIAKNKSEQQDYQSEHVCIEPYEMPWLERSGVKVLRQRVENADRAVFQQLEANEILFIDSSRMIRAQGNVLCEFRYPANPQGRCHRAYSGHLYSERLSCPIGVDKVRFRNEQYLPEAFLSGNPQSKIMAAINYLTRDHYPT